MTRRLKTNVAIAACALAISACAGGGQTFPDLTRDGELYGTPPVVVRQPVVPEMLVNCNGHVLVPALGMTFVRRGKEPPVDGQYLREERLSPPYRVIPPGVSLSPEQSPTRVNLELDSSSRIVGLFCG